MPLPSSITDAAPTLPPVRRSIVDEVCIYKEQVRGVRSDRRKKKLVKYGKRAAVVGGVVALGVVGGAYLSAYVELTRSLRIYGRGDLLRERSRVVCRVQTRVHLCAL